MNKLFSKEKDLFATFIGQSMSPTLREPEIIKLKPYENRSPKIGDVIFYLPQGKDKSIIHRVIRITKSGIKTRGDNNSQEDDYFLHLNEIKGQVVTAMCGSNTRQIKGGLRGRLVGSYLHKRKLIFRLFYKIIRPAYRIVLKNKFIVNLAAPLFNPSIIRFQFMENNNFVILFGKKIIGRYDRKSCNWRIHPFFRLFVNKEQLKKIA